MAMEIINFYPRSPCGERPTPQPSGQYDGLISIHALLAESDPHIRNTLPGHPDISIHALLAESDRWVQLRRRRSTDFYPRSPCGERHRQLTHHLLTYRFLSTLSLRRATSVRPETHRRDAISIHALLAESDDTSKDVIKTASISIHALLAESDKHPTNPKDRKRNFYPRSPCGERP